MKPPRGDTTTFEFFVGPIEFIHWSFELFDGALEGPGGHSFSLKKMLKGAAREET